eukprot:s713_g6.t1
MTGRAAAREWRRRAIAGALRGRAVRYVAYTALCCVAFCGCCLALLVPRCVFFTVCAALGGPALVGAAAVPLTAHCWISMLVFSVLLLTGVRCCGVHASSLLLCKWYTFLLLSALPWPCDGFIVAGTLASACPICPPRKKSRESVVQELTEELDGFIASHGRVPLRRDDVAGAKNLYSRLQKADLLELLKERMITHFSKEVDAFIAAHGRAPVANDEVGAGKAIYDQLAKAKLMHLLKDRAEQPEGVVDEDLRLRSLCEEVRVFLHFSGRLPRRRKVTSKAGSEEKNHEDRLAQRWARVVQAELPKELQDEYADLFEDENSRLL